MENKNILNIAIVLTIGIILAGSLMMPVLNDAQKNAGASVTRTNNEPYTEYGEYYTEGFTMVIDNPATASNIKTSTVTVNDESIITRDSWSRHVILSSNNLIVEIDTSTSSTNLLYATYQNADGFVFNQEIAYHNAVTITYDKTAGTITVSDTAESIDITVSATYCFALSNNKDYLFYNTANQIAGANFSEKDINNKVDGVISVFAVNLKVNGGDDMFTWVISDKSGTRVFYDPAAYEGVITATLDYVGAHLVAGTTDIYTGGTPTYTFKADNPDDVITPSSSTASRSFVKAVAEGHEDSGAAYSLYGVIPAIVIIGLVVASLGAIITKRD